MWKFLLAWHQQGHQRSSPSVWNLHLVPEPECCSTPHTYTNAISPMADVCHRYLHLEGIDHLVVGDFYLEMIFVQCLPPGQSNANKVVSLLKEMFSEHASLKSFTLTMAHNMQVLSSLTSVRLGASHTKPQVHTIHSPMDLLRPVSSLPNMHSNEPSIVVLIHTLLC